MSCLHCIVQGEMYDFQTDRILTYYSDTGLICVVYKFSVAHNCIWTYFCCLPVYHTFYTIHSYNLTFM